jgi:hypothetical protein
MHRTVSFVSKLICLICIACQFTHAQDNREGDSLALVALNTANSSLAWNTAETINNWSGVTAGPGPDGRVTSLYIGNKNVGLIPAEIGNLTKLESFIANNNTIYELPAQIGNCTELIELVLEGNLFSSVPVAIGSLTNLINLTFTNNQITTLPTEIGNLSSIVMLYFENNELTSIPAEMANLSTLSELSLNDNKLHFDDIELMNSVETFYYSPQKVIGLATTDTLSPGLKIGVVVRGSKNHYAWTKDGSAFGTDADSVPVTEAGVYVCSITSDSISGLTLTHQPITVVPETPIIVENNKISYANFTVVPNPYNHLITICYHLSDFNHVELTIFNITGQKISTIVSQQQPSGGYSYEWDAGGMAGGAYFCRFTCGDFIVAKKLILFK